MLRCATYSRFSVYLTVKNNAIESAHYKRNLGSSLDTVGTEKNVTGTVVIGGDGEAESEEGLDVFMAAPLSQDTEETTTMKSNRKKSARQEVREAN